MRFEHSFTVPADIDTAWKTLANFDQVAPCIPGATIESVAGDEVNGSIKVRLGSIGPTYKGTMTFVQRDHEAHRFVLKAHAETRTSGSATAGVVATLSEFGGSTTVLIISDVEFTGKAGQLEASVIADAGTRVVRQFAQRLADVLAAEPVSAPDSAAPAVPQSRSEPAAPAPAPEEMPMSRPTQSSPGEAEEPTPTPDRSADSDVGDSSPPQVMPERVDGAPSNRPTPDGSARRRDELTPASAGHRPSLATKALAPNVAIPIAVVLLLLLRRRRRRRRNRR